MKRKMNKKNQFKTLLIFILLTPFLMMAQELLKMPKPTHFVKGVPTSTLELVKEIDLEPDKDLFFAVPWDVKASKKTGWIYVYDAKLIRIFIFDENYRYIGQFLDKGQGPGEVNSSSALTIRFHPTRNGDIYVTDSIHDRFLRFSPTGKYLDGKRMYRRTNLFPTFTPVSDKSGFIYGYSVNNGIVDMMDSEMKCVHTFLDKKLLEKFVIYKRSFKPPKGFHNATKLWKNPRSTNTYYGFTSDERLLIYLFRSSTAYVFKGKKLERKFEVLIDRVLPLYKESAQEAYRREKDKKNYKPKGVWRYYMFHSCFVDEDEPYFYLSFLEESGKSLFKFDLKGDLMRIIRCHHGDIKTKVNGLFYGTSPFEHNPVIYKEK